jgi:hypothetical protein
MCWLTRDAYRGPVLDRMHLMELHDPSSWRDAVTDTLESILGLDNLYAPIVPRRAVEPHGNAAQQRGSAGRWRPYLRAWASRRGGVVQPRGRATRERCCRMGRYSSPEETAPALARSCTRPSTPGTPGYVDMTRKTPSCDIDENGTCEQSR